MVVHLELVSDLTKDFFLSALRGFLSRRGQYNHLYSNCDSNLMGASLEMPTVYRILGDQILSLEEFYTILIQIEAVLIS